MLVGLLALLSTVLFAVAAGRAAAASGTCVNSTLPVLSGTAQVGKTLTSSTGTWSGSPTGYAYQWQFSRDSKKTWTNVNGATLATFREDSTFQNTYVRVQVTAKNAGGQATVASAAAGPVAAASVVVAPVVGVAPAVTGQAQVGQSLAVSAGTWSGAPTGYAYQWQFSADSGTTWINVTGATLATFREDSTFQNTLVRAQVTATNSAGSTTVSSNRVGPIGVAPVAPANTALPQVSGTAQAGKTLSASAGTWSGSPTGYAYQWQRCDAAGAACVAIAGATGQTLALASADTGSTLRVAVSASNAVGTASATSPQSAVVQAALAAPVSSALPVVSGTAQVGNTLAATAGSWLGSPTGYAYQWQRCDAVGLNCVAVAGATGTSYTLVAADAGATMRIAVSATNAAGTGVASSAATAIVQAAATTPPPSTAGLTPFGSWEGATKTSEFADSNCNSGVISLESTNVREGTKAALWSTTTANQCYGDTANVRVHMLGFPSGKGVNLNNGATYWFTSSVYFPTTTNFPSGWYALNEIHQSSNTGCKGPAPFNLDAAGGKWRIIVRGYPTCADMVFDQSIWGTPQTDNGSSRRSYPFANGIPYTIQKGQWYDFLFGFHMATDKTGWFEAWMNGPGTNGKSVQIVNRTNLATSYTPSNYPMVSVYYPVSGNSSAQVIYDGIAFSADFQALKNWQNSFTHSW